MRTVESPDQRPPGVPEGARRVTLHQLWEECRDGDGFLSRSPRGSLMRFRMDFWPFGISGKLRQITGRKVLRPEMGYGVHYQQGWRGNGGANQVMVFRNRSGTDYSNRILWVWTLQQQQQRDWQKAGRS